MYDICLSAKGHGYKARDESADKNTITGQCMVISTSNLVGIIDVRVDTCGILAKSVG